MSLLRFCCALLLLATGAAQGQSLLSVGSGEHGGGAITFVHQLSGRLADRLATHENEYDWLTIPYATAGEKSSLNQLGNHEIDLAITSVEPLLARFRRLGKDQESTIRIIAPLKPALLHILVRSEDADIDFSRLSNKHISVGLAGFSDHSKIVRLLEKHGLDLSRSQTHLHPLADSIKMLRSRKIAAAIFLDMLPNTLVEQAVADGELTLKSLDAELTGLFLDSQLNAYYQLVTEVPYDIKDDIGPREFTGISVQNFLVANASLSPFAAQALYDETSLLNAADKPAAPGIEELAITIEPIAPWHDAIGEMPEPVASSEPAGEQ